jgi:hypothetical protein
MAVPNRIRERVQQGLRRRVPIIQQQRTLRRDSGLARDVSEAGTVTLVKDTLAEVFGFDKYPELTSEHAIRGTYCDVAVKLADNLVQLIEVKSAGSALDDRHAKEAIDYARNLGVGWSF